MFAIDDLPPKLRKQIAINPDTGCWIWTGRRTWEGRYGDASRYYGEERRAHRALWKLANGPIPDGLLVLHKCDVPLCVNPEHLFLGTQANNRADMVRKGRERHAMGERNGRTILSESTVLKIRRLHSTGKYTIAQFAQVLGVGWTTIADIVTGKRWRHLLPDEEPPTDQ